MKAALKKTVTTLFVTTSQKNAYHATCSAMLLFPNKEKPCPFKAGFIPKGFSLSMTGENLAEPLCCYC